MNIPKGNKTLSNWSSSIENSKVRSSNFDTLSGHPLEVCYFPDDIDQNFIYDIGAPGQYPYTRGIHSNLYRGKLWTMRQFAGFGTPEETNQRFKLLLNKGQTGLSVAYDMPTLMGYDPDHNLSLGEVGKCGVNVFHIGDMEKLFDGINLGDVSVSQTINGPAIILFAFYVAVAEKQGVNIKKLKGTLQNDILKEFIAQKEWIFPPDPSMRLITDMLSYCADNMPLYNTISVSGYHIREAGSTAAQELAFTLADGFTYLEHGLNAGLDIDSFAPRISFFFNSHSDFFEEIAKYRAARRIWAKRLKNKYGAKSQKSMMLRFHTQTAGCSLTAQQPEINIARTSFQAMAAVLGGTQSLHTNSMDETLALPSEKAAEIALRTQQLIAYETRVANVVDPLGGSWFVEKITNDLEQKAEEYFNEIDDIGGVICAIEQGYQQREIAKSASEYQNKVDSNEIIVVGVNKFVNENEEIDIPILKIDTRAEKNQMGILSLVKNNRDDISVRNSLKRITKACSKNDNLVIPIIEAAKNYCTLGEIVEAIKVEFGEWSDSSVF